MHVCVCVHVCVCSQANRSRATLSCDSSYLSYKIRKKERDDADPAVSVFTLRKQAHAITVIFHGRKNDNFQLIMFDYFHIFCLKHRLWVLISTASMRRF